MVKTRSSDSPYLKKSRPRYTQPSKVKQPAKKRKRQPKHQKQSDAQEQVQSIDPEKFVYRTRMISPQSSFDASLNVLDMPTSFHQSDLDLNSLEMIAIMEHKSDYENTPSQEINPQRLSRVSTEKKLNQSETNKLKEDFDSQFGFTMQGNRMAPHEFKIFCERQGLDLSCNQVDIEVQQQISLRQLSNNQRKEEIPLFQEEDRIQQQPYNSLDTNQQQQNTPINELLALDEGVNLVAFGPPNIDQLSTNCSLNINQSAQMEPPNQVHHIFIQNDQNIFENLSDGSTRPCMSHPDQGNVEADLFFHFSEDQYNELLWKLAQNLEGVSLSNEDMHARLYDYLDTMGKFVGKQAFRALTKDERIQFWRIMNAIQLNIRDQDCIRLMIRFVANFQYSDYDEKNQHQLEYQLVRARLEGLRIVYGSKQGQASERVNLLLNDYFNQ